MRTEHHTWRMVKIAAASLLAASLLALSGCNTVSGVGKDLQGLGNSISHLAD